MKDKSDNIFNVKEENSSFPVMNPSDLEEPAFLSFISYQESNLPFSDDLLSTENINETNKLLDSLFEKQVYKTLTNVSLSLNDSEKKYKLQQQKCAIQEKRKEKVWFNKETYKIVPLSHIQEKDKPNFQEMTRGSLATKKSAQRRKSKISLLLKEMKYM